ncbi:enhancer of split M1 protein [Contarinia nasturtii]|uniref:enhancer of split M1 protein n=1 Tax=Contarinia nasturtii TaxID=265458 RepID=UPI0012D49F73|nr:enhancer of split M1 protein [Contarinia nasturtii]
MCIVYLRSFFADISQSFKMKILFTLLFIFVASDALPYDQNAEQLESSNCDKSCTFIYSPVCATDGENNKIFASPCVMERHSCLEGKEYRQAENKSACDFTGWSA